MIDQLEIKWILELELLRLEKTLKVVKSNH